MRVPDRSGLIALLRAGQTEKAAGYAREIAGLDAAAASETKSSAGDKYETAREMIAQTRRLMDANLVEAKAGLEALERMAAAPAGKVITFGSLVETSQGWFLLGTSFGEIEYGGITIKTASLASPIGAALKGKHAGDKLPWRGSLLEIIALSA